VLRAVGGNRAQAAAKLGIGTATLYRKLKLFGIGR
jgi:transcriptional regulator of acetoin/glycerol metabolism